VRFCEVELQASNHSSQPPVRLWAVHLHESAAEDGGEPIEWLLLTGVAVTTFEHAVQRAEWYAGVSRCSTARSKAAVESETAS